MTLWHWLLRGSDELILPKTWLRDTSRMARYDAYTQQQLQQGSVVKDVAAMRRAAFWTRMAAKRRPRENVVEFPDRVNQR